jgi:molybdopterin synthase catalytic subunit
MSGRMGDPKTFTLSARPLDTTAPRNELAGAGAGALVEFEGRVRDRNEGRMVTQLEYEGAEALATGEFEKIATEARAKFEILDLRGIHRTGKLAVGEVAVWIGVTAAHRGPAFDACRFVIDELKKRLPIWKKEYYLEGDSGWINAP